MKPPSLSGYGVQETGIVSAQGLTTPAVMIEIYHFALRNHSSSNGPTTLRESGSSIPARLVEAGSVVLRVDVAIGPFPQTARRTRRADFTATRVSTLFES